jgi:steroid delta-isomerase-like uncharacterized protein
MSRTGKEINAANDDSRRTRSFAVSGQLLRSLRAARGWTQREAAQWAGVSDRLIRKAEMDGPIELKSIALLAQLYSTPDAKLTPKDILTEPVGAPAATSQEAEYEALVRRWWEEVWNQGRLEVIAELASTDCVLHADGAELRGPGEVRQRTEAIREAFSDIHIDVEQVSVQGDWVISRWRVSQIHSGTWMGMPPTGQRIVVNGSTWMRVENGLLAEGWDYWEQQQASDAIRAAQPASAARTSDRPPRHKDTKKTTRKKPKR